jgi:hypothetical protein
LQLGRRGQRKEPGGIGAWGKGATARVNQAYQGKSEQAGENVVVVLRRIPQKR